MKSLLLGIITVLALGLSSSIVGQGPNRGGSPKDMAEMQTEHMKTDLGLSEDQVVKVGAVNLKYAKKHEELRDQESVDKDTMQETMEKMNDERNVEMKKILSEEQYQKFLEKEEEMRKNRPHDR